MRAATGLAYRYRKSTTRPSSRTGAKTKTGSGLSSWRVARTSAVGSAIGALRGTGSLSPHHPSSAIGADVGAYRRLERLGVPAPQCDHNRQSGAPCRLEHEEVALLEASVSEGETSQSVLGKRVDAG